MSLDQLTHSFPGVWSLLNQIEQRCRWLPIAERKGARVDHAITADDTKTRNDIGRKRERSVFHAVFGEKWNVRVLTLALRRVYSGHF